MAKLYFRFGCMNSGKSMQLLATAYNFQERNIQFMVIKSSIDTRDGEGKIHSRSLGDRDCTIVNPNDDIIKVFTQKQDIKNPVKWILVDEAQFLTTEQVDQLSNIVDYLGVNVICYGLRTDFKSHLFEGSKRLFEISDTIEEIKSSCCCGSKTIVNARVDKEGKVITDGEQVEVGGDDRYISMCRKCYNKKLKK